MGLVVKEITAAAGPRSGCASTDIHRQAAANGRHMVDTGRVRRLFGRLDIVYTARLRARQRGRGWLEDLDLARLARALRGRDRRPGFLTGQALRATHLARHGRTI